MTDLSAQTPVEIDTELSRLYDEEALLQEQYLAAANSVFSRANMRRASDKPRYRDDRVVGTLEDARVIVEAQAAGDQSYDWTEASQAQRVLDKLIEASDEVRANHAAQEPLHAEFARRGWTRAFLVLNTNGHVHNSMYCNTCFPTTSYGWLPQLSGHSEDEIVAAAGSDACTVCFPSAPVDTAGPRTVLHHTEEEARRARVEKDAAKVKKLADQIVVDGYDRSGFTKTFKTQRAATNDIASNLNSMVHYGPTHPSFAQWQKQVEATVAALVAAGVEYDLEAKLDTIRAKVRREHANFMKSATAAQYRAQGVLDPKVDEPGYDPAKY